jgi:BirA family biotin operon repressor/biotin-[acetyl-CoA-carboxylase] ligase
MAIYCDSLPFAAEVLPEEFAPRGAFVPAGPDDLSPLIAALLGERKDVHVCRTSPPDWMQLILAADAARSQCDRLLALSRDGHDIPDRTACLSRTGRGFRGFKGRSWSGAPGNIHLAVHFAPGCVVERFEVAFTILAALAAVEAIDGVPEVGLRAGIRWVNDIVVGDAKLGGVLAHTQTCGRVVTSAILGIGLNVAATPDVEPTPFVPAVSSLHALTEGAGVPLNVVVARLLDALQRNYRLLLQAGYRPLLDRYRQRSTILGRECTVCTDESDLIPEVIATGRVVAIGDGLELELEGRSAPITRGRLFVGRPRG